MASEGGHNDENAGQGEQEPAGRPSRNFEEPECAVMFACLAFLVVHDGDAAVVGQNACTQEDLEMCPVDGPGNNEYMDLSPQCTILSAVKGHADFEELEKTRLQMDPTRAKRLDPATINKRMPLQKHTAGSGEGGSESGRTSSSKQNDTEHTKYVFGAGCATMLQKIKEALKKRQATKHFYKNERGHLCGCTVSGVVHGLGIVDDESAEGNKAFGYYLLFLRACGRRVDGDAEKEAAREEWKKILADLRGAHKYVVLEASAGRRAKPCEAQSTAIAAVQDMQQENEGGADGPRDAPAGDTDLTAMLESGTAGMVRFVSFLACNPRELQVVDFLCAKIQEALEGETGRRFYNLLNVARQATHSVLRVGNRAGTASEGLASPGKEGGQADPKQQKIEELQTQVASLQAELTKLKQAQILADSLDQTHASMFSDGGLGGDSTFGEENGAMMMLSPEASGTGSPAKCGDKRVSTTPLSEQSNNKRNRSEDSLKSPAV
ncbi:MAG: hypothetical protein ACPIOQ_08665 [Promethearchaeia archaeon]